MKLGEVAKLVEGELAGDADLEIRGASILRDARSGDITLVDGERHEQDLQASCATAVIVGAKFQPSDMPFVQVSDVHRAFARIVANFHPPRMRKPASISPAAHISPAAELADGVDVHAGAVIGDEVKIGRGSVVHSGVCIMDGCQIGEDVTIFPNAVLYENVVVGSRVILHAGVVVGAYGFGYDSGSGRHVLSAQLGNVVIEDDVEIGAATTIDRGTYGATRIGAGTKIDNLVQIGHNCLIGRHNLLCSQVGIAGSCTTGDYVVMGGQVGLGDHLNIGAQARLGAQAGFYADVPEQSRYLGTPAMPDRDFWKIWAFLKRLGEWRRTVKQLVKRVEALEAAPAADDLQRDAA